MELLIPGLILVALMAWASTRIKKRTADAFEAELVQTDDYALRKPEGFLHVLGDDTHEFMAYSSEFREGENSAVRRATIEMDVLREKSMSDVRDSIRTASEGFEVRSETGSACEIIAGERANQTSVTAFYKIVSSGGAIYRLRFAVVPEHREEYLRKIEDTLDSFTVENL